MVNWLKDIVCLNNLQLICAVIRKDRWVPKGATLVTSVHVLPFVRSTTYDCYRFSTSLVDLRVLNWTDVIPCARIANFEAYGSQIWLTGLHVQEMRWRNDNGSCYIIVGGWHTRFVPSKMPKGVNFIKIINFLFRGRNKVALFNFERLISGCHVTSNSSRVTINQRLESTIWRRRGITALHCLLELMIQGDFGIPSAPSGRLKIATEFLF